MGLIQQLESSNPNLGRESYVCFCGFEKAGYWWDIFTRPGFRHVFGITQDPLGNYVMVDYSRGFVEPIHIGLTGCQLPVFFKSYEEMNCALSVQVPALLRQSQLSVPIWSCVEMVKSQLGLFEPWVLTPFQLYNKLLAQGATVVWRRDGEETQTR